VVVRPGDDYGVREIGKYGGGFLISDAPNVANAQGYTGYAMAATVGRNSGDRLPFAWKTWESDADNTVWTFHLREALKWSDGELYTTEDVLFWFNDLMWNPVYLETMAVTPIGAADQPGMRVDALDDLTLQVTLAEPTANYGNMILGDRSERQLTNAAAHYLREFHPNYTSENLLASKVAESGFANWSQLMEFA